VVSTPPPPVCVGVRDDGRNTQRFLCLEDPKLAEVGGSIIQIDKSIIDNYRSVFLLSNYRFTKIIDLSITIRQNHIFNGSIIIDLGKNYRVQAFIDLNYRQ